MYSDFDTVSKFFDFSSKKQSFNANPKKSVQAILTH